MDHIIAGLRPHVAPPDNPPNPATGGNSGPLRGGYLRDSVRRTLVSAYATRIEPHLRPQETVAPSKQLTTDASARLLAAQQRLDDVRNLLTQLTAASSSASRALDTEEPSLIHSAATVAIVARLLARLHGTIGASKAPTSTLALSCSPLPTAIIDGAGIVLCGAARLQQLLAASATARADASSDAVVVTPENITLRPQSLPQLLEDLAAIEAARGSALAISLSAAASSWSSDSGALASAAAAAARTFDFVAMLAALLVDSISRLLRSSWASQTALGFGTTLDRDGDAVVRLRLCSGAGGSTSGSGTAGPVVAASEAAAQPFASLRAIASWLRAVSSATVVGPGASSPAAQHFVSVLASGLFLPSTRSCDAVAAAERQADRGGARHSDARRMSGHATIGVRHASVAGAAAAWAASVRAVVAGLSAPGSVAELRRGDGAREHSVMHDALAHDVAAAVHAAAEHSTMRLVDLTAAVAPVVASEADAALSAVSACICGCTPAADAIAAGEGASAAAASDAAALLAELASGSALRTAALRHCADAAANAVAGTLLPPARLPATTVASAAESDAALSHLLHTVARAAHGSSHAGSLNIRAVGLSLVAAVLQERVPAAADVAVRACVASVTSALAAVVVACSVSRGELSHDHGSTEGGSSAAASGAALHNHTRERARAQLAAALTAAQGSAAALGLIEGCCRRVLVELARSSIGASPGPVTAGGGSAATCSAPAAASAATATGTDAQSAELSRLILECAASTAARREQLVAAVYSAGRLQLLRRGQALVALASPQQAGSGSTVAGAAGTRRGGSSAAALKASSAPVGTGAQAPLQARSRSSSAASGHGSGSRRSSLLSDDDAARAEVAGAGDGHISGRAVEDGDDADERVRANDELEGSADADSYADGEDAAAAGPGAGLSLGLGLGFSALTAFTRATQRVVGGVGRVARAVSAAGGKPAADGAGRSEVQRAAQVPGRKASEVTPQSSPALAGTASGKLAAAAALAPAAAAVPATGSPAATGDAEGWGWGDDSDDHDATTVAPRAPTVQQARAFGEPPEAPALSAPMPVHSALAPHAVAAWLAAVGDVLNAFCSLEGPTASARADADAAHLAVQAPHTAPSPAFLQLVDAALLPMCKAAAVHDVRRSEAHAHVALSDMLQAALNVRLGSFESLTLAGTGSLFVAAAQRITARVTPAAPAE